MQKQHGGTLDIVLLRPLAWLAEQVDEFDQLARADSHSSALGHAVWSGQDHAGVQLDSDVGQDTCRIHLALPELGAVGPAEVLAIEPCPSLASGPGRTVTGTFAHAAADVLDLEIEGLDTPLGCTANHPFWSADRQDFVPAGSLTIGEHLRTESGTLRQVTRITPRRGPPVAVFNLEVDAEHVYYVSTAGVLVHNTYPGNAPTYARRIPGTPGQVTGGSSTTLGRNMMEEMGLPHSQTWPGYQAQHVLPSELSTHPVLQKIGMDLDHASNGMFLPTPDKALSPLARHRGYHSVYNEVVERKLSRMDISKSIPELEQEVFQLQQRIRHLTRQGTPLYPSQGATVELWERLLNQ
jgi:hypothetical protein